MLYSKRPAVLLVSLAVLLTSLTACNNSQTAKNLQQAFAADPRLKDSSVAINDKGSLPQQNPSTQPTVQLPTDFPKEIPLYSNANLQQITPSSGPDGSVSTHWLSSDPSNLIASFYSQQFQANNWQILQQPTDQQAGSFEARRNDIQLKVTIQPKSVTKAAPNQPQTATELLIEYTRNTTTAAQTPTPNDVAQPGNTQTVAPVSPTETTQPTATPEPQNTATPEATQPSATPEPINATSLSIQEFSDLSKVQPEFRQYIKDLTALGVLSVGSNAAKNNITTNEFQPGKIITRREYARWLVAANNSIFANNPAKQIRLAPVSDQSAFSDLSKTDPDFPAIQGLAEAGIIPSPLSGDSTAVLFRPDAPLTREQLILWKLPLDTRQALPSANLDTVKQTWGFQDAAKIDTQALRTVLADFQNGEKSNIRRVFGYTTLFQPKKPVTRAEAAAALWYFGTQGEGVSAQEALKLKK
ncbi:MAG: S-layer homology domain-containing protein [Rhizonema sp. PD37]|nr:S-layer homology domain-containing protein [Rhizonema sp. PD37]